MKLVEMHKIRNKDPNYEFLLNACISANNLYNHGNYIIRQKFIETTKLKEQGKLKNAEWLRCSQVDKILQKDTNYPDYRTLPTAACSQQILRLLDKNWKSFFESIKKWKKNPNAFTGRPKLPKYRKKQEPFMLIIPSQKACKIKNNKLVFTKAFHNLEIKTRCQNLKNFESIQQVRIIPKRDYLKVEVVYSIKDEEKLNTNLQRSLAIDVGIDNLMTITTNLIKEKPIIINGKPIKAINHYFNKQKAYLQSRAEKCQKKKTSKRLQNLSEIRENKINDYFHKVSKWIVDYCKANKIGNIIIGHSNFWKQNLNLGKINNQKFTQIPFSKLFQMIRYKALRENIWLQITEESYTSKASFYDNDEIPVWNKGQKNAVNFSGKRIKRGLYQMKNGQVLNADVNGSLNIMRKVIGDVEKPAYKGFGANPLKITMKKNTNKKT